MKTHTIKTPTAELLIVELSESAKIQSFSFEKKGFDGIAIIENGKEPFLIKAHFTLLGKPDEIREENAKELVEIHPNWQPAEDFYIDYKNKESIYDHKETAKESLLSLLESEIYWNMNPYGKEPRSYSEVMDGVSNDEIYEDVKDWHEAEQKTFNRNRSIIFKKVTPKI